VEININSILFPTVTVTTIKLFCLKVNNLQGKIIIISIISKIDQNIKSLLEL